MEFLSSSRKARQGSYNYSVMESEVSRWLASISCGLELKSLAKEFEDRGFTTKESMKYVDSCDLDVFFPSPLKLCYAKKKILLKEISMLSTQLDPSKSTVNPPYTHQVPLQAGPTSSQATSSTTSSSNQGQSNGFLATKQENMTDEIQFLETRISSAKIEYIRLLQEAEKYDEAAPKKARTCTNCHQPGHQKRQCNKPSCPGICHCNLQSKHPEFKSEMTELQSLIKELEKKSSKSKDEFLNFKAAREKASNSFFAIMRPRLKKCNAMKYAGTDRLYLDRDLLTLKKALENKVPLDENSDWKLPFMIEEYKRRSVAPLHVDNLVTTVAANMSQLDGGTPKSTSSRKLSYL